MSNVSDKQANDTETELAGVFSRRFYNGWTSREF